MTAQDVNELYEALARWQWRRRSRRELPGEGLELRKRLTRRSVHASGDGPEDGGAGLDRWLQGRLGQGPRDHVLDLGCGFGASLLRWARAGSRRCVGIGSSAFQIECARSAAAALGLSSACSFVCADFATAPDGPFDVVLAIEALGHATLLAPLLRRVHDVMRPGGRFFWLDDVRSDSTSLHDAEVQALARFWRSPPLRTAGEVRAEIVRAGLVVDEEAELTARVPIASSASRRLRSAWLTLARPLLPTRRQRLVAAAFLGGIRLERLYARGAAQYRAWLVSRPTADTGGTTSMERRP